MLAVLWNQFVAIFHYASWSITALSAIILALIVWRLWRFSIRPYLYPDEPKELPHWIPLIGHTISFFGNSHDLIEKDLEYTSRTHEPFALQVGTETLYIVTSPKDVAEVFKRPDVLPWEGHLNQLFLNFGFTKESLKKAWLKPNDVDCDFVNMKAVNPKQLSLIHLVEQIYAKQLLPGHQMNVMSEAFTASLQSILCGPKLENFAVKTQDGSQTVSLRMLCQHTMLEAGVFGFFGKMIDQIDPDFNSTMIAFTSKALMLFYGLPTMFASAVLIPQRALLATFQEFARLPEKARSDQSWSVQQVLIASEALGIDVHSRACMLLMVLWAAYPNFNNAAFWVLAHVLVDEQLLTAVKQEISAAWRAEKLDIGNLCDNAPALNNTFNECLRLNGGAMMGRKVQVTTRIGNKRLKKGASIIIPSRQLHHNEDIWGDTHTHFNAARFSEKPGLLKHSSYRPFGDGVSLCPGRKIAKEQVFALVAILFHRFDIALTKDMNTEFPRLDFSTPAQRTQ